MRGDNHEYMYSSCAADQPFDQAQVSVHRGWRATESLVVTTQTKSQARPNVRDVLPAPVILSVADHWDAGGERVPVAARRRELRVVGRLVHSIPGCGGAVDPIRRRQSVDRRLSSMVVPSLSCAPTR